VTPREFDLVAQQLAALEDKLQAVRQFAVDEGCATVALEVDACFVQAVRAHAQLQLLMNESVP
jgi:hypothetical protein